MTDYLVPGILLFLVVLGIRKQVPVYSVLVEGGRDGLQILGSILPGLVILVAMVHMLRASGGDRILTGWLTPICTRLGIPPETGLLVLIRPISGSAALAVGADLMARYGPDSLIGRTTAVMLGSTETTFYTVSVYFGAAGIQKTRYTIPAALIADLTGFTVASLTVRLLF